MISKVQTLRSNSEYFSEYLLYTTSFLIPFLVSGPQLLIGSLVNTLLFLAAGNLSKKHMLPLAILPSLAALARGYVFGPHTPLILVFMPFIWIGNYILMSTFSFKRRIPRIPRVMLASALKALTLISIALIYVQLNLVPKIFLSAMGWMQFQTAMIGGLTAIGITRWLDTD